MKFTKPIGKTPLEITFLEQVEKDTPERVKTAPIIDLNNKNEFTFTLKREHLDDFDPNGEGLGIQKWFNLYKEEAKVSTAGIRGLQNPLYPWDTRYPLNLIGVMLATMGKVLVAQDTPSKKEKVVACEVRYNSKQYVELIARIQAAYGIKTHVTKEYETIPIFLISFIIFMNDLYGGEYVTSSHAMAKKIATKDLNTQGSQYIPSESLLFVNKVEKILNIVKEKGEYTIKISADQDEYITSDFLSSIENGISDYVKYLKSGIATPENIQNISKLKNKVVIDTVGGSFTNTFGPVLSKLGIREKFDFVHSTEDPFNHEVGKTIADNGAFFDWSCDTTIMKADLNTLDIKTPVVNTVDYKSILANYPTGTVLLMTDPDADRLVTSYIDSANNAEKLKSMGLVYTVLDNDRLLVILTPNQSFLMNIDFQQKALSESGLWGKYDWFILKTSASQRSWDEWAMSHNTPVVNTPVGFKELADTMINIEKKMEKEPGKSVHIRDVFGNTHDLGTNPRMLFAGEESGGEIFGPPELITSKAGRKAISMREKSAGEATIITAAMVSWLEDKGVTITDYLQSIFVDNRITSKYEIRVDQKYYNESEPDINKLLRDKELGMIAKTKNNSFFLSLALGYRDKIITLEQVKAILAECFTTLNFDDLKNIYFCGDGTYILFESKCLEVRPSGTDAVNKGYAFGIDQWECIKYAQAFASYTGERTPLHSTSIPLDFYNNVEKYAFDIYSDYKANQ